MDQSSLKTDYRRIVRSLRSSSSHDLRLFCISARKHERAADGRGEHTLAGFLAAMAWLAGRELDNRAGG